MNRFSLLIVAIMSLPPFAGCAAMSARWNAYIACKAEQHAAKGEAHKIRLDALSEELKIEQEQLSAQRESHLAALRAHHQHELACLQAAAEKESCLATGQFDESVRTKLGMDLDQRVHVGQLQVNMDELKRLVEDRDLAYSDRMRAYNEEKRSRNEQALKNYEQSLKGPCCRCAQPDCSVPPPGCETPHTFGCCRKCGLKPIAATDCAGTRPFQGGDEKPLQEPLLATDIPLMLPVRLELGVTNSYVNESKVRRLPYGDSGSSLQNYGQGNHPVCTPQCIPKPECAVPSATTPSAPQLQPLPIPPAVMQKSGSQLGHPPFHESGNQIDFANWESLTKDSPAPVVASPQGERLDQQ